MSSLTRREAAEAPAAAAGPLTPVQEVEARLWTALQDVEDPEIPISVVGMGLIVSIAYRPGTRRVDLQLTFTAMGCPASDFILEDVRERLLSEPGVQEVRVNVVWDPPWTVARMTEAGRDALESWGLAV